MIYIQVLLENSPGCGELQYCHGLSVYARTPSHRLLLDVGPDAAFSHNADKLGIDIADVDIGKNIGAELQTEQAEADKKIAQAKAEERRAMAIAQEQEMKAKVEEMKAKVVESEAEVPLAMAHAFKAGNMGIMDYMNYQNLASDTKMRESIGNMNQDQTNQEDE